MTTRPLPFQQATIVRAVERLTMGSRRFLVADEVGLGKTIVAQGVIAALCARPTPLRVFYVCNSLAIARQNRRRLLDLLPDAAERARALCPVDRLTLMVGREPTHPKLRLFTLTPATSFPRRKGRPRKGRQDERAMVRKLVAAALPDFRAPQELDALFSFGVKYWPSTLGRVPDPDEDAVTWFRDALAVEFEGAVIEGALEELAEQPHELIGRLRSALAVHALQMVKPDLVVFDEFQRFRDLLRPGSTAASEEETASAAATRRVLRALRGDDLPPARRPALLLLSATPYLRMSTPYRQETPDTVIALA